MNPAMFLDTKTMEELLPKLVTDCCNLALEIHQPYEKESNGEKIAQLLEKTILPYTVLH